MVDVEHKIVKMGATSNINTAKLANLQERKKTIEESLAKCNQELRELCIQEADLTGTLPLEMPLEPGESPPSIRRRVGTSYQLPENLIKNTTNKDESIAELELQIQLHANMAEAALGLANEHNIGKTVRRQHMTEYQQHKLQYTALQEKLTILKERLIQQQQQNTEQLHKQKKKPRPTEQQDDNISINDTFNKSDLRHSIRSVRGNTISNDLANDQRYSTGNQKMFYKNQELYLDSSQGRFTVEESLASGLYRLSINGYKNYMEKRENMNNIHKSPAYNAQMLSNSYHNSHIQKFNQNSQYKSQSNSQNNFQQFRPNNSTHNSPQQQIYNYPIINLNYSQEHLFNNNNLINSQIPQQSSPNSINSKVQYYPSNTNQLHYKYYSNSEQTFTTHNPHQIQPHQQYEDNIMTSGLGGYWKQSESGEMIWCNSVNNDSNWQRDKRFGSLDRRKNKRLHKRISPSVNNKSATLSSVPTYSEHIRSASIKSSQVVNRRTQDNRQLIRTQSLGSVGVQTVDSVWRSDDNSSCESDNRSINDISQGVRKLKQKEWLETSLDGPVSPTHSIISQTQTLLPSSNDDYFVPSPSTHHVQLSQPKQILEIPAESNPSPRISDSANIELFNNNNIPKNCTVVQAGHCKPYHEETKPFEMSDFYKYSTKFKKSPIKQEKFSSNDQHNFQKNLNDNFDDLQKQQHNHIYHHQKSTTGRIQNFNSNNSNSSPRQLDNSGSLSSSFDLNQISNTNVAEHFSNEMNAWYKSQKFNIENNNTGNSNSKNKSTATLV